MDTRPDIMILLLDFAGVDGHSNSQNHHNGPISEPVRIIHKDQESISAFCLNHVNPGFISLATPREVQEMDISLLLESPNWMEDECELDILNLTKDSDSIQSSNFLVIQAASDKYVLRNARRKKNKMSLILIDLFFFYFLGAC